MEPACWNCTRKHLATTITFIHEFWEGYEGHDWLAMGELNAAAREIRGKSEVTADLIRGERKNFENDRSHGPGLFGLILAVTELEQKERGQETQKPEEESTQQSGGEAVRP